MQNDTSIPMLLVNAAFLSLPVLLYSAANFFELPINEVSPEMLKWMRILFGLLFPFDLGVYGFLRTRRVMEQNQTNKLNPQFMYHILRLSITASPALYGFFLYLMGDSQGVFLAFCAAAFLATLVAILWETLSPI